MADPATLFLVIKIARWWKRVRPIRSFKENRKVFKNIFKGKLTYSALATLLATVAASALGDGVVSGDDLTELGQAVVVLVAVFGRWRAIRKVS
jgi:hypothetical protein